MKCHKWWVWVRDYSTIFNEYIDKNDKFAYYLSTLQTDGSATEFSGWSSFMHWCSNSWSTEGDRVGWWVRRYNDNIQSSAQFPVLLYAVPKLTNQMPGYVTVLHVISLNNTVYCTYYLPAWYPNYASSLV